MVVFFYDNIYTYDLTAFTTSNQDIFLGSYAKLKNPSDSSLLQDENVRFIDEYDEELSHLIISGSDILICPSFDDPLLQVPVSVS